LVDRFGFQNTLKPLSGTILFPFINLRH